ncbi:class I SAM-dependent methyltransferase [Nocardioides sp. NPDC101246]|uniref:class I SAM-dependent methyltransferase n=1 Tax=Nocardioides sp. NPDC101246 TaxID=3364336 RepID=UPI00380A2AA6
MHTEALAWVVDYAPALGDPASVLDIGGRDVNGTPRHLFPSAEYVSLDVLPGADITADAATWQPDRLYDAVVCTEVFEHAEHWRDICRTAHKACVPGGALVITCAGPGRALHSGVDGGPALHPGEWYCNVSAAELRDALETAGWTVLACEESGADTRAFATKEPR